MGQIFYRIVDFKRRKFDVTATVERIEYDPNRTAFIALIRYSDGEQAYILAPQRLAIGDAVVASAKADIKPGNAMPFSGMPIGTIVHNIELKPGKGGQIARAAGTYLQTDKIIPLCKSGTRASVVNRGAGEQPDYRYKPPRGTEVRTRKLHTRRMGRGACKVQRSGQEPEDHAR